MLIENTVYPIELQGNSLIQCTFHYFSKSARVRRIQKLSLLITGWRISAEFSGKIRGCAGVRRSASALNKESPQTCGKQTQC